MQFKFFLRRGAWGLTTELFGRCKYPGDENHVGLIEGATIRSIDLNDPNPKCGTEPTPLMAFQHEDADTALQALMDELWSFGVRPSDIGTPGHIATMTKHLEDMRAIAFAKLEVAKP